MNLLRTSSSTFRTVLFALLGVCAVASAQSAAPTAPNPAPAAAAAGGPAVDVRTAYAGTFRYAGNEASQRRIVEAAIERAVDGMFFVARPIARGKLRNANPYLPNVTLSFPPGQIAVSVLNRTYRSGENGATAPGRDLQNNAVQIRSRIERGQVVQLIRNDEGEKRTDFILSPDGRTLTLRITVTSGQLPRPLRYELTFRR